jgi:hypothetical protein
MSPVADVMVLRLSPRSSCSVYLVYEEKEFIDSSLQPVNSRYMNAEGVRLTHRIVFNHTIRSWLVRIRNKANVIECLIVS